MKEKEFELSDQDKKDFEEFCKTRPTSRREPLDVAEYLHMCRIGYDAAPLFDYSSTVSDLYVVGVAKCDDCNITPDMMHIKMEVGDTRPEFMRYHPEEMGFYGPYVRFEWDEEGWIMNYIAREYDGHDSNGDILRFIAMRRAGYPVVYYSTWDHFHDSEKERSEK